MLSSSLSSLFIWSLHRWFQDIFILPLALCRLIQAFPREVFFLTTGITCRGWLGFTSQNYYSAVSHHIISTCMASCPWQFTLTVLCHVTHFSTFKAFDPWWLQGTSCYHSIVLGIGVHLLVLYLPFSLLSLGSLDVLCFFSTFYLSLAASIEIAFFTSFSIVLVV